MIDRERDACGIGFVADRRGGSSREIVAVALEALRRVRHRGALAADARSGDGAGLMVGTPRVLLGDVGVGMVFVAPGAEGDARPLVERALREEALGLVGWREVPVRPEALGEYARRTQPRILQVLFERPEENHAERRAYRARRRIEHGAADARVPLYAASMSYATVTYKALCAADQLAAFYPDLEEPSFRSSFALFHQRYSTNTAPSWERAQPFRFLGHNGEINTIQGNVLAMRARESRLGRNLPAGELTLPVIDEAGSDSSMLDNAVELLVRGGRSISHAMAMVLPRAWENDSNLPQAVREFYRYQACLIEPWDGPAAIVFADGRKVGACLDRNGLRPLRYAVCDDGLVTAGSEVGLVDLDGRGQVRRGRLGPGEMLVLDTGTGELLEEAEAKSRLASSRPYGLWLAAHLRRADPGRPVRAEDVPEDLPRVQAAFGYTREELTGVVRPMALTGHEPTSSMGDDTALPPLASQPRTVFGSVKQRFAQVTNPPIDSLHERSVMSLSTRLGPRAPLLEEQPEAAALVELPSFFVYPDGLRRVEAGPWPAATLDATFDRGEGLRDACRRLGDEALGAVESGARLLVVSDRAMSPNRAPVPSLLAVGTVHHRLAGTGLRPLAGIACDTGDVRDVHQAACLLGFGADVLVPRVALQTIAALCHQGRLGRDAPVADEAQERFRHALEEGVLKIMSKMGISTLDGYRRAQVFEVVGLSEEVVALCLAGAPTPLGGVTFEDLERCVRDVHSSAFGGRPQLPHPGFVKHRAGGEFHATNPDVVGALHRALGLPTRSESGDDDVVTLDGVDVSKILERARSGEGFEAYRRYADLVDGRPSAEPRDLLELVPAPAALPLEDVEPVSEIVRRFSSGAMSHGALSAEAHEALARGLAMIGARANTGEGGEDRARFRTDANSPIKQVASARFGVTPEYCAFAEELQIKMAQGSKPGEGGQLPAHKVTEEIARLRHTQPGVPLISPPPHHDIYSIEDLAQLIYDLKQVSPRADISVKLVSTADVGVIATGVAKAMADVIHIAGSDGGTGASPLSSIKNAGLPWEVGLARTQAALIESDLRGRVRVRVDGGMKTGRDVIVAALLGADEFSFGTAALLAQGCIMVRACHRDTCPTGIATQRPELREKFLGTPEQVAAYFLSVAHDVRRHLATLGLRSVADAIGRVDLLRPLPIEARDGLEVGGLLVAPVNGVRSFRRVEPVTRVTSPLGDRVAGEALPAVREGAYRDLTFAISNGDRAVGARLGGRLAREFGPEPPPGRARIHFRGAAGQSFGAFLGHGIEFRLVGEANDYVGKGMAGGRIVIKPPEDDAGDPVLVGNTVLYGATGGELFCAGRAGERFGVRNSGALAVVEGVGDHACEYMTGGTVLVLGPVGPNLGAGMSGGSCWAMDQDGRLADRVNPAMVRIHEPSAEQLEEVRLLIERHLLLTDSPRAFELLASWGETAGRFRLVVPTAAPASQLETAEGSRPEPARLG